MYAVTLILVSLEYVFLYCYFGTRATMAAASIDEICYRTAWYSFSPEIQKCLPLIIGRAQQAIYFSGFKLAQCSLETFAKVVASRFSFSNPFSQFVGPN